MTKDGWALSFAADHHKDDKEIVVQAFKTDQKIF